MSTYIKIDDALEIIKRTSGDYAAAFSEISHHKPANVREITYGYWEDITKDDKYGYCATCSSCGVVNKITHPRLAKYCPRCGARLKTKEFISN